MARDPHCKLLIQGTYLEQLSRQLRRRSPLETAIDSTMTNGSASGDAAAPMEQHGLLDSHRLSFDAADSTPRVEAFPDGAALEAARPSQQPPRTLTFLNGVAIVVGIQIGSGIFSTPGSVIGHVHSSGLAVLAWFLAGLMVWTGATSVVQLGTLVPANGGMQEYLSFLYDDSWGFLFAWCWIAISRPCGLAMVSLVFSEYLYKAVATSGQEQDFYLKPMAIMAIVFITALNCLGTPMGKRMGSLFLGLKVIGLFSIPLAALFYQLFSSVSEKQVEQQPRDGHGAISASESPTTALDLWRVLGGLTDAVLAAVFAYGGWESVSNWQAVLYTHPS
jgi:solute carrier family 7 (L-type amino acid transporter), member 6